MNKLTLTIDRLENEMAVLKKGGESINFPRRHLPDGVKEGDIINFVISKDEEKMADTKKMAKEMLNEIINGSN